MSWRIRGTRFSLVLMAGLLCTGAVLSPYRVSAAVNTSPDDRDAQPAGQRAARKPDPDREYISKKMMLRISLERGIDPNTPLKDALEFISDRYDLKIDVDLQRYKKAGFEAVGNLPIQLPKLHHVRLASVLRMIAKQVNGVCLTSAGKFVIVPDDEDAVKALIANGHAPLPPGPPDEELQSKVFTQLHEAYHDAQRRLRSGSGTGTFEIYEQLPTDKEPQLTTRAHFTLHFDHKRYYLSLRYEKDRLTCCARFSSATTRLSIAAPFPLACVRESILPTGMSLPSERSRPARSRPLSHSLTIQVA
jgi:hypothetical protein